MTVRPNSIAAIDAAYVLHPFTNLNKHRAEGGTIITGGRGVFVIDETGKEYIESMAGLACVSLGFSEHRLADAAAAAMRKMPYYHHFFQRGNEPSALLAEKLIKMMPVKLSKVFFTSSGSEANDTAVKLIWYYNNAIGRPERKKIIARQKSYHGTTIASASLCGLPTMHQAFDLPIPNIIHTDAPYFYRNAEPGETPEQFATRLAENLEKLIVKEGPETIAALLTEPIQSAGGTIVPPATYFEKIQAVLKKYGIMFVLDEVITGFGRTGHVWGAETYGIKPDAMVIAKAITSAYQPLGAVIISEEIYQGLAKGSDTIGGFFHGFTYSGHPVACSVALETLKIYEERRIFDHVARIAPVFQAAIRSLAEHPLVGDARGVGLAGAIELVKNKETKAAFQPAEGFDVYLTERLLHHGVIARVGGGIIAFMPPLIITEAEIKELARRLNAALDDALAWADERGLRRPLAAQ
ncbi:MAG: aminotransferase [Alphaproteobacteria bacterium]